LVKLVYKQWYFSPLIAVADVRSSGTFIVAEWDIQSKRRKGVFTPPLIYACKKI